MADKYISALTGPEMDAALLDMAQHNSEAWAVGTRNGEDVPAIDVTYHNNAKYYSDRAVGAAARAEGAVPAGTSGALFFDQAQTLTDAQKRQVYANISNQPGPTENLVDNGWFLVNQRGKSSYATTGEFVFDRWYLSSGAVQWSANGISTTTNFVLNQIYPENRFVMNGYNRVSVLLSDGTIYSSRGLADSVYHYIGGIANPYFRWRIDDEKTLHFQCLAAGAGMVVRALKVENDMVAQTTIGKDQRPDYASELIKCRRFLYVINSRSGTAQVCPALLRGSASYRCVIPLTVPMYDVPSVSLESGNASNFGLFGSSTSAIACDSFTVSNTNSYNTVMLTVVNSTISSSVTVAVLAVINSDRLIISAEI